MAAKCFSVINLFIYLFIPFNIIKYKLNIRNGLTIHIQPKDENDLVPLRSSKTMACWLE